MPIAPEIRHALEAADLRYELDVQLARKVWWRTGGPADVWIDLDTRDQLVRALGIAKQYELPIHVMGNGSNVLVADRGIEGIVLHFGGELAEVTAIGEPPLLTVGAGMKLTVLLSRATKAGWTGLGCYAGIPGTIGGAIRMNAGSSLGETANTLIAVEIVKDHQFSWIPVSSLQMSYRSCSLPPDAILVQAKIRTTGQDPRIEAIQIQEFLNRRKATQPLDKPSCGSTFRNPPGVAAGSLIEKAGLKGFRIGNAEISMKHANFIVNLGNATSTDIEVIIRHVQATVFEKSGIFLEPEVHRIGRWKDETLRFSPEVTL